MSNTFCDTPTAFRVLIMEVLDAGHQRRWSFLSSRCMAPCVSERRALKEELTSKRAQSLATGAPAATAEIRPQGESGSHPECRQCVDRGHRGATRAVAECGRVASEIANSGSGWGGQQAASGQELRRYPPARCSDSSHVQLFVSIKTDDDPAKLGLILRPGRNGAPCR